jgi:hypothetical protein
VIARRRGLHRDESGAVAIILGLTLGGLVGFAALAIEGAQWYAQYRQVRTAVDAAALSAAVAYAAGDTSGYTAEATAVAARNGYVDGTNSVSVAIHRPPLSGSYTGNNAAIEIVITAPQRPRLAALFLNSSVNISARAVAVGASAAMCGVALGSGNVTTVRVSNGASVTLNQCGLDVNASSASAVTVTGGASLTLASLSIVGGDSVTNGGAIHASGGITTHAASTADPYAGVSVPGYSGCVGGTGLSLGHNASTQHLSPNVYCNGLAFTSDAHVVLNSGTYIIDRGSFSVGGAVTLTGTNVTIVLTSSTGSNYATATVGNGASVSLTAPTSGTFSGVVVYGDRNAPTGGTISFTGGSNESLTGAIYAPTYSLAFSNGSSSASQCTQLLAHDMQFTGGVTVKSNCAGVGTASIGGAGSTQVLE